MKILMLNYEYPPLGGGGAAVTKELCEKISEHGGNIDVVTMGFKGLPAKESYENINILRVKCWRSKQRVCHPWEQLSYCIRAFFYIKKNLNISEYDFIHCHFIIPTGLLAYWLNKKYGIKYMVTAHGSDVIGHNNARFSLMYKMVVPGWKKILKNASIVTAPSQYLVDKIHETESEVKVELVPNGIKASQYKPGSKKKSIITLTRLQESKGVQNLISACAETDMNGWEVNVLGDGPYRQELERLAEKLKLQDIVHFRGHVEGEERMQYLSEAGCFFSGSQFEAFPLSVLEASLCGCNIIASNIKPHILLSGEEHTYEDINEMKKMLTTVTSSEPRVCVYNNDQYDWEKVYSEYEGLYGKLINE